MMLFKNKLTAFTLVELIVVITILAILGTIAFINLQGYSIGARDSKRISDINNIQKKIGIEVSKGESLGKLILPVKTNSGLTIDNGTATSIQGIANFQTLKENGESFKDPITKGDYIISYSIGGSGTGSYKFTQISTINEELNQAVVKGNYYKMQTGDSPSLIKNNSDNYVIDEGIDLPYLAVVGGGGSSSSSSGGPIVLKTISNCGTTVGEIIYGTVDGTYTGLTCSNDIIVCNGTTGSGYTISSCNVGATIAWSGDNTDNLYNQTNVYGKYFQWGRNKGFVYGDLSQESSTIDGNIGLNSSTDMFGFVWDTNLPSPFTWANTDISDNWGDITNTYIARQGPCASGYHVPSQTEWENIITDGGWGSDADSMQISLKLPYAGLHYYSEVSMDLQGGVGHYWSSSTTDLYFYSGYINPASNKDSIAYGFPVRCFKN
ncbi:MAG: prepilin-type N-terminal cleavage/methylation domain-containing protein [Candidatus Gracilibacteria bacterium]|nr:prepilin-type N-terminal cleavage/methylation domain-containing protein [Candidatus Gracilibacteria bacterium]